MAKISVVMSDGIRMYTSGWKGGKAGKVAIGRRFIKMAKSAENPEGLVLSYHLPSVVYTVVLDAKHVRVSVMPTMTGKEATRVVTFDRVDWETRMPIYINDEQALSLFVYIFKGISE